MFIFTAKFNRLRAVIAVIIFAAVICGIIIYAGIRSRSDESGAFGAIAKNNEQRVEYLNSLGWEVVPKPLEEQSIIIPRSFNDVYTEYNALQISQGFDLKEFGGCEATRYTYTVLNHPDSAGNAVADIIVYRNRIIAGDVQSTALDGFMHGLAFPDE